MLTLIFFIKCFWFYPQTSCWLALLFGPVLQANDVLPCDMSLAWAGDVEWAEDWCGPVIAQLTSWLAGCLSLPARPCQNGTAGWMLAQLACWVFSGTMGLPLGLRRKDVKPILLLASPAGLVAESRKGPSPAWEVKKGPSLSLLDSQLRVGALLASHVHTHGARTSFVLFYGLLVSPFGLGPLFSSLVELESFSLGLFCWVRILLGLSVGLQLLLTPLRPSLGTIIFFCILAFLQSCIGGMWGVRHVSKKLKKKWSLPFKGLIVLWGEGLFWYFLFG